MTTFSNSKLTDEKIRTRIESLKNSARGSFCSTFAIDAMLFEELLELRKQNELQRRELLQASITLLNQQKQLHEFRKPKTPAQPVIPEGLIKAINRLLDNDGSRGCFDALEQHRAKTELELLLTAAQPVSEPYKSAANDIIAERQRQISEKGWTPEHDDKYNDFHLALAAACYAQNVADYATEYYQPHSSIDWTDAPEPEAWPWSPVWWKPSNPRRDLVKAGALILAEIERMDRTAPTQESK